VTTTPDRDELWRRNQLARTILTQRDPNPTTVTLALCALDGVPLETLIIQPRNGDDPTSEPTAVNWRQIAADVRLAIITRGISQRGVARVIGIPESGIPRLLQGKRLSADALAALVVWLYPEDQTPRWTTREVVRGA
jgi:predicted XRE-type DNA-binding protein